MTPRVQASRTALSARLAGLLALCIGAACQIGSDPTAGDEPELGEGEYLASGRFQTTAKGQELGYDITGALYAAVMPGGTSLLSSIRSGLADGTTYPAHLHVLGCAEGGGGHYKIDPNVAETVEQNEIWLQLNSTGGAAQARVSSPHIIRGSDARSVVIHDPVTKDKIACADIQLRVAFGQFANLPGADALGYNLSGMALLVGNGGRTTVYVMVNGLAKGAVAYPTHVHNDTCAAGAGGHYEHDPAVEGAVESNEIWPIVNGNAAGAGFGRASSPIPVRPDAQAVAIHDPDTKAKVGCADLD